MQFLLFFNNITYTNIYSFSSIKAEESFIKIFKVKELEVNKDFNIIYIK